MSEEAVKVTVEPTIVVPKSDFIKYIGTASTRAVYVNDWPVSLASKAPNWDLIWDARNHWTIKKSDLDSDIIQALADDGNFIISEG